MTITVSSDKISTSTKEQELDLGLTSRYVVPWHYGSRYRDQSTGDRGKEFAPIPAKDIAFIDGAVEDKGQLVAGLSRSTEVVILPSAIDGVAQITFYLQQYRKQKRVYENVHIVSHGAPGCLYLGNTQLSLDTLDRYASDLQQWVGIENLLLYGCQVAGGDAGEEFLGKLHAATGANIGASKTRTGNARKGGNWNLEVTVGELSCPMVFSKAVENTYAGVLDKVNVSIEFDTVDGDTSSISALIASPGADGEISLREAVIAANNTAGDDTIILTSGQIYDLSIPGMDEDGALAGDLDILNNGKITIVTVGAEAAVIDALGTDRVFEVLENASLALDNVEVTGGYAWGSFPGGGGILVNSNGSLELTDSNISGNQAERGGGISNKEGNVRIANSTISGNTAFEGGGIFNGYEGSPSIAYSTIRIAHSTIGGNTADRGGGIFNLNWYDSWNGWYGGANIAHSTISGNTAFEGGGIFNEGSAVMENSTVSGNTASGEGGGISNIFGSALIENSRIGGNTADEGGGIFNDGSAFIENSTLSDNTALVEGGGVFNFKNGSASIGNSTLSGNMADRGGGVFNFGSAFIENSTVSSNTASGEGGGIFNRGSAFIENSIIAANGDDKDLFGTSAPFTSGGHNLIGNNNGITEFTNGINDDIVGNATVPVDPLLGPLQNNGGPTLTHAPLVGSLALDNGSSTEVIDQRGVYRPQNGLADIGAVEVGGTPNYIVVDITTDENDGTLGDNSMSLRDAIILANSNPGDFIIQLEEGQTYDLSIGGTPEDGALLGDLDILNNGKITIVTLGAEAAVIDARGTNRVFEVLENASLALDNVEVTGGVALGSFPDGGGGGILVNSNGSLELTDSTISGNTAEWGGGISNNYGNVRIGNSTIGGNTADRGGGIFNINRYDSRLRWDGSAYGWDGGVNIGNSTIGGNTALEGGGIFNEGSALIESSTISDNTAEWGGGISNLFGSARIANSSISGNIAFWGGGILNDGSASIENSTLRDNTADSGGGISNFGSARIANSTIGSNTAAGGGGISNDGSASIENSTIGGNTAEWGGGIFNNRDASIENSKISDNTAERGGGIFNVESALIENSNISGNTALVEGGGIFNYSGGRDRDARIANSTINGNSAERGGGISNDGSASIENSTISGNTALVEGGGILNEGDVTVENSTVSSNTADGGGGIFNNNSGNASIAHSTITGNTAGFEGGGIFNDGGAFIENSIVAANMDDKDLFGFSGTFTSGGHNLIGNNDGFPEFTNGINNDIVGDAVSPVDPQLGPLQNNGGPTLTHAPLPGSQALDNGSSILPTDQRGVSRPQNGQADIGAVEVGGTPNYIVVDITTDENDGTLGDNSMSLRDAIILANSNPGDFIIQLEEGKTYNLTIAGTEEDAGATGDLDILDNGKITIVTAGLGKAAIDAGGTDRVFDVRDGASLALDGIEVTGGSVVTGGGGGILVNFYGSLELTDSAVNGNTAGFEGGGGIFNSGGSASIANSTISGNTAFEGGGILNEGDANIANSTLSSNTADRGGGISHRFGSASIANSTVRGNTAFEGGGIFNDGNAWIANSTISGNMADRGGGIYNSFGNANIANSTISGNRAEVEGGGIFNNGDARIANSTISDNTAADEGAGISSFRDAWIGNSIVAGNGDHKDLSGNGFWSDGYNLIGNNNGFIEFTDGMFGDIVGDATTPVDPGLGPLQNNGGPTFTHALLSSSPAINAGETYNIPRDELDVDGDGETGEPIEIDQRGEHRVRGKVVDIGAYESNVVFSNFAPQLYPDGYSTLTPIDEDPVTNDGNTVAEIVTNIMDYDGPSDDSIAVIAVDNSNGVWQYSTDGGSNWSDFSGITGSNLDLSSASRLLDSSNKIRFVPDPEYSGTAEFAFRAWDESAGTPGGTANTTINGGSTTFSRIADTAEIVINEVDEPPYVANAIADVTVDENAVDSIIDLADVFADPDNDDNAIGKVISANSNSSLVSGSISGNSLTLDYQDNQSGTAEITVEATSNSLTVTDSFTVTVNALPTISIEDVTVSEGNDALFAVSLDVPSTQTITVDYGTADDTTAADSDYSAESGSLTFNPGETSQTITVGGLDDSDFEGAEQFFVNLSNPSNATIADNQGIGTITDDDFNITSQPLNWELQATADFDGDGKADLLWRDPSTGDNQLWLMDGETVISTNNINFASTNWDIKGVNDFNGDDKADILLRNSVTGENSLWLFDGATRIESGNINRAVLDWNVADTNDFNGDNKADILLRNSVTGQNSLWMFDGRTRIGSGNIRRATVDWEVADTNDFNGDNKADILLRNSIGQNSLWTMDGLTRIGSGNINGASPEWKVADTNDFNGDNKADILWRNSVTGENTLWMMDERTRLDTSNLSSAAIRWEVGGTSDFDGDGDTDIFWRDPLTGENALWLMDGVTYPGGDLL